MAVAEKRRDEGSVILCIEDEPELRADIIDELCASGHDAIGANGGRQALDILRRVRPDLILCDISMPGMDGYAFLETLRTQRTDLGDVPFVFLTALNQRDQVITGKRAGADDYLVKPIDFDLMLASIDARLGQARRVQAFHLPAKNNRNDAPPAHLLTGMTSEVLDLLSFGVVLANRECEIAFVNHCAEALAEESGCFSLRGQLRGSTSDLSRQLRNLVAEVAEAAGSGKDIMRGMALPRPDAGGEILLVICALSGTEVHPPLAAIFISDSARQPAPPEHLLAALFGLTPAEAQMACRLVKGGRTSDMARELNISPTTVAFHLRNLFAKTGTNRQADLVALLMKTLAALR